MEEVLGLGFGLTGFSGRNLVSKRVMVSPFIGSGLYDCSYWFLIVGFGIPKILLLHVAKIWGG